MNRMILAIVGVFSASSLLLADSAVKGAALLLMAVALVALLRRNSAATSAARRVFPVPPGPVRVTKRTSSWAMRSRTAASSF